MTYSMYKHLAISVLFVLLGSGCAFQTVSDPGTQIVVETFTCPDQMTPFHDSTTGLQFCHPDDTVVQETTIGSLAIKNIDGVEEEALREMRVLPFTGEDFEAFILETYANPLASDEGITCSLMELERDSETQTMVLIGVDMETGEQTLDTVTKCRSSDEYRSVLAELSAEYFIYPTNRPEWYVVLNGEQENILGDFTDDFEHSISFE